MVSRFALLFVVLVFSMPMHAIAKNKLTIFTTNYPLTYFAERIGGVHVNVVFPAPPDVDPAFWTPVAATTRKYQQADLIVLNGAGYEKWSKKVSLPLMRSVDTSRSFKGELIHADTNVSHSHGPGGDHSHGGTAFTTWLDFSQAALQAEAIYKAISRKIPSHKADISRNFESLQRELLELDARMIALSDKKPGLPIVASHPIYQYMARRYNLNLQMVMWEPDEDPGERKWHGLQELLKEHPAKWMIWEGEPLVGTAKRLKVLNVQSQVFSPCFARPAQGDFLSVMQQNITNMELIFK